MNVPMYELASKIAIASRMIFSTHNGMSLSGSDDGYESGDERFHFTISKDLLLDPNDIKIGDKIGEGGHSVVYNGLLKNGVLVAVKVLKPTRPSRVSIRHKEKFQDEVLLLSKMKHDNIVKFVGACIEPHLAIVTEILEGGTLERVMWNSRPKPLDLKMSLSFALDISQAMEFMHSNGIIHRDLNPRNVLVTADQKHAKLIDFGLAKDEDTGGMTCQGGTYRWMAPEVCSPEPLGIGEKKHYNHKIDVYSFSLVFWMLLTNKTPFHRIPYRLSMSVPYFAYQGERPSLENIPDELASVIESCWAQDSNSRPEFKQITVLLKKLLSRCVSDSNGGTILLEEKACDNDSENIYLIQECYCDGVKEPKEKKMKKKKVVNMFRPLVKMVKAFLSKP